MCAQCMAGAATAAAGATGIRIWLVARLSGRLRRAATAAVVVLGLAAAALVGA